MSKKAKPISKDGFISSFKNMRILDASVDKYARVVQPPELYPGVCPPDTTPPVLAMDSVYSFAQTHFTDHGFPGYQYLAGLTTRPEYRAMASSISNEITRKWISFSTDNGRAGDKISQIESEIDRVGLRSAIRRMAEHDCYFGRGQLAINIRGADNKKPIVLSPRSIGLGALESVVPVEAQWTTPANYDALNPMSPDFYRPIAWYVMGQLVHASRMCTVITRPLPNILTPAYNFSGISLSQLAEPYVDNWLRTRQSVSDLINNFSITVLKTDMMSALAGEGDSSGIVNRAKVFTQSRSNLGLMMVDMQNEELVQLNTPLSGLHELQAQAQEQLCSVSRIPAIVLTGLSPSGLNASSEGEIRVFYDWISSIQDGFYREPIQRVINIIQLSLFGEIDKSIRFDFIPLHQLTELEKEAIRLQRSQMDVNYINSGVLSPDDVRESLINDKESGYNNLGDLIDEEEYSGEVE